MSAPLLPSRLDAEISAARAELVRVDGKASMLLALGTTVLSGGLAVLGTGGLTGRAGVAGWIAAGLIAAGVLVVGGSAWPRLTGGFGFMAWAASADPDALVRALVDTARRHRAHELRQLSLSLRGKYRRIQAGMALMGLGVLAAIVTAGLWSAR